MADAIKANAIIKLVIIEESNNFSLAAISSKYLVNK